MQKALLVFFVIASSLVSNTVGHSYVECADWRFKTPLANRAKGQGWAEDEGTCHANPRQWPAKRNLRFGNYDNVWPGWKVQGGNGGDTAASNPNNAAACYIQPRTNPITNSYAPNSNYGPMVVTSPGKQLCFKWSGRNHADNGETCDGAPRANGFECPVYINFAPTADVDPTQAVLSSNNVAIMDFSDCTRKAGYTNADRPCGGCFTVPQRPPGTYTVQWRWALNQQGQFPETYATCIDVKIEASTGGQEGTPPSNPATSQAARTSRTQNVRTSASRGRPRGTVRRFDVNETDTEEYYTDNTDFSVGQVEAGATDAVNAAATCYCMAAFVALIVAALL